MVESGSGGSAEGDRVILARVAAYSSWAKTDDRTARTRPARASFLARFEVEVDPEQALRPEIRRQRAEAARRA